MKTKIFASIFALFMTAISGSAQNGCETFENFLAMETERLELEDELFGFQNDNNEIISINYLDLYEVEEEIELDFDTRKFIPSNFDPYKGMNKLNWDSIPLYEVEEEIELDYGGYSSEAGIGRGR